jgi:hypothetical protein
VSTFLSSVVLALVGLLITWSIHHAQIVVARDNNDAQIAAAKVKAADDKRIQEGQLTAQLVQHLASKDPFQREIAVIALRASVPPDIYENVVVVLAKRDESKNVRSQAIEQLSRSSTAKASQALGEIARNPARQPDERQHAAVSSVEVGVRQAIIATDARETTIVIAATNSTDVALDSGPGDHSPFAYFLLKALDGSADTNGDQMISGAEAGQYVVTQVPLWSSSRSPARTQRPVFSINGRGNILLASSNIEDVRQRYKNVIGLIVAPEVKSLPRLISPTRDAQAFAAVMKARAGLSAELLLGEAATKNAFLSSVNRIATRATPEDLFVLYFTGYGAPAPFGGSVSWHLSGGEADALTSGELKDILDRIPARNKAVFIDSCYAGALLQL